MFGGLATVEAADGDTPLEGFGKQELWWKSDDNFLHDLIGASDAIGHPKLFWPSSVNRLEHLKWGTPDHYIEFSGQVNKGVLFHDDGGSMGVYPLVDNNHSSTRFRAQTFHRKSDRLDVHGTFEVEWTPLSTHDIDQESSFETDWTDFKLRKAEVWFDLRKYGQFWIGQGSMASDNTARVDLSGTTVIGNSNIEEFAGGQYWRLSNGDLSDLKLKEVFRNQDGLGRLTRIRYDTREFNGFTFSASAGGKTVPDTVEEPSADIAVRYQHSSEGYRLAAAGAVAKIGSDESQLSGSISVLHDSGLNFTVAAARRISPDRSTHYIYGKLGYIADWFSIGRTALSADFYRGRNFVLNGSESHAFGFQAVQNIDRHNTQVYLGVRSHNYSEPIRKFQKAFSVLTGARTQF